MHISGTGRGFINWKILGILAIFLLLLLLLRWAGCGETKQGRKERKERERTEKSEGKKGEKEEGEEEQDSTEESSGPGIIERIFGKEKVVIEQTFEIWYEDKEHKTVFSKEEHITPWVGNIKGHFRIVPKAGQVIKIHLPGWYDEDQQPHDPPPPVIFRGGQTNPKLPMHGKGDIYIYAAQ